MINKDAYQQKLQAQLNEWKAHADLLKAKAEGASADLQIELNKQIEQLKGLQGEAQAKFDELRSATGDKLTALLSEGEDKLNELKSKVDGLVSNLSSSVKSLFK